MTCIVGLIDGPRVVLGADRAGITGWDLRIRRDPKVFSRDGLLIAFTSSFRMGQLLQYSLIVPQRPPDVALDRWMRVHFIASVRDCLKAGGFAETLKGADRGGCFLVGVPAVAGSRKGRLFRVESDFNVSESMCGYDAAGCGDSFALGALSATERHPTMSPEARVKASLRAAERFSAGVRAPFDVLSLSSAGAPVSGESR